MFVYTRHAAQPYRPAHIECSILLATGKIAGTGFAQEQQNAEYFACVNAIENGCKQAACGHAQYLCERDEEYVRATAAKEAV